MLLHLHSIPVSGRAIRSSAVFVLVLFLQSRPPPETDPVIAKLPSVIQHRRPGFDGRPHFFVWLFALRDRPALALFTLIKATCTRSRGPV